MSAKAKALIAEILGGPVPVDPKGVARLDLARMMVAGAGFNHSRTVNLHATG